MARFSKAHIAALIFVLGVTVALSAPVFSAVVVAQKTPTVVVANFEKTYKSKNAVFATGVFNTTFLPEDEQNSYDLDPAKSIFGVPKLVAAVKAARLTLTKPPRYIKEELVDGTKVYRLNGALTQAGTYAAVQAFAPLINKAELSPREYNAIKTARKNISGGKMTAVFRADNFNLTKFVLTWTTTDAKFKNKVVNELVVLFEGFVELTATSKSSTTATEKVNITANAEAKETVNSKEAMVNELRSVVVTAGTKAVDANGNGGVVAVSSGDSGSTVGRDTQRFNDLKALQTALELYFIDQGFYPNASALILGQLNTACLNSDGFTSADNCPYPYMLKVPSDSGMYVYSGSGSSYAVTAKLEGILNGYKGTIQVTPNGLVQK